MDVSCTEMTGESTTGGVLGTDCCFEFWEILTVFGSVLQATLVIVIVLHRKVNTARGNKGLSIIIFNCTKPLRAKSTFGF